MGEYSVELGSWDYLLSVVLILCVTGLAMYYLVTQESNVTNYLLAGKEAKWWVVGCSLFSYGTGVEYIGMMVADGASVGISGGIAMWGSIPPLLTLGYILYSEYMKADVLTLPTFLYKSFNSNVRGLYTVFSLVLSVTKIAVSLHYTSNLLEELFDINPFVSKVCFTIFIQTFTMVGGLRAIMSTEVVQTVLLVVLSTVLMVNTVSRAGGYGSIKSTLPQNYTKLVHSGYDKNSPWQGLLFGFPIEALVHWCCDQVITQKALASRSELHAKVGCCLCCFLNVLPPFLFVLSGMAVKALFLQQPDRMDTEPEASDTLLYIISTQMPDGTVGLFISVLLCSLTTSVASVLTACGAIVTVDVLEANVMVFKRFRGNKGQRLKVAVGRLTCLFIGLLGLGWSFLLPQFNEVMYRYMMDSTTFSAAILCAFLCAYSFTAYFDIKPFSITTMLSLGIALGSLRIVLAALGSATPNGINWYRDVNHYSLTALLFVGYLGFVYLLNKIEFSKNWNILQMSQITVRSVSGSVAGSIPSDSDVEEGAESPNGPLAPPDCGQSDYGSTYQGATLVCGSNFDHNQPTTVAGSVVSHAQHDTSTMSKGANVLAAVCLFCFIILVVVFF
eukprot:TRINITY_DN12717_c1_g1_i1.p1 TRINITY_DN12717_c1_g1~~TRINITY_DN12717_c1_g1_i1.p1  ORF type:complete len:615 (+),score=47.33 TRINITY_DN12717_c1_g1_i1:78-1922(+)